MIVITGGPLVVDSMAKEAGNDIYYLERNHERLGKEGGITMNVIDSITKEYKKNDIPEFNVGDTVRVHVKKTGSGYWCREDFPNAFAEGSKD